MPTEVIMPKVDMDMATGKIMRWHVAEGEAVAKGDPLFDIETDKAAMEIESAADGILHHTAPEGTEVPIGTPCAWLYAAGEEIGAQPRPFAGNAAASVDTPAEAPAPVAKVEVEAAGDPPADVAEPAPAPTDKARATPLARALAAGNGIDIGGIAGTGPQGRVQANDVRELLKTPAIPPAPAPVAAAPTFRPETGPLAVTRSKGGEGTPVVLLHGFASDAASWAPVEAHLRHRPVIRIELPGHGKSPRLGIDSFADLVKEVRQAFDSLDLPKAHLVGHSLGGAVALALADTRTRRVASLTLIAPAGLGPEIDGTALNGICRATRAESLAPWLRTLVANEDIVTDAYVRLAMAGRIDPALRAAQSALAEVLFPDGVQAFDLRAALDRIDLPCRILWGRRDAIIPWKHALRAPGRVALHLFDGIGHMPQIECAEAVGTILKAHV